MFSLFCTTLGFIPAQLQTLILSLFYSRCRLIRVSGFNAHKSSAFNSNSKFLNYNVSFSFISNEKLELRAV